MATAASCGSLPAGPGGSARPALKRRGRPRRAARRDPGRTAARAPSTRTRSARSGRRSDAATPATSCCRPRPATSSSTGAAPPTSAAARTDRCTAPIRWRRCCGAGPGPAWTPGRPGAVVAARHRADDPVALRGGLGPAEGLAAHYRRRILTPMNGTSDTLSEMPAEELTTAVIELPFHHRVRLGVRRGANWMQLVRFCGVGASGYAVNLISFAVLVHPARGHILGRLADRLSDRDRQQLHLEPPLDVQPRTRGTPRPPGVEVLRRLAVVVRRQLRGADLLGPHHRDGEGAGAGDRQRRRDAGQLPRPEALELQALGRAPRRS